MLGMGIHKGAAAPQDVFSEQESQGGCGDALGLRQPGQFLEAFLLGRTWHSRVSAGGKWAPGASPTPELLHGQVSALLVPESPTLSPVPPASCPTAVPSTTLRRPQSVSLKPQLFLWSSPGSLASSQSALRRP